MWKGAFFLLLAVVFLMMLWGCGKSDENGGTLGNKSVSQAKPDAAVLEKTALAYWTDRLITRKYQSSYDLESKGDLPQFEEYEKLVSRNENFIFSALKAEHLEILDDSGTLDITLKAKAPGMPAAFDRTFKDTWSFSPANGWRHQFSKKQP